jgi:F0F1-type ATP synthase membrane subunit b/b'
MPITNEDLAKVARAVKEAEAKLDAAREDRANVIREALAEGEMTAAHIGRQLELSREMIRKLS